MVSYYNSVERENIAGRNVRGSSRLQNPKWKAKCRYTTEVATQTD